MLLNIFILYNILQHQAWDTNRHILYYLYYIVFFTIFSLLFSPIINANLYLQNRNVLISFSLCWNKTQIIKTPITAKWYICSSVYLFLIMHFINRILWLWFTTTSYNAGPYSKTATHLKQLYDKNATTLFIKWNHFVCNRCTYPYGFYDILYIYIYTLGSQLFH